MLGIAWSTLVYRLAAALVLGSLTPGSTYTSGSKDKPTTSLHVPDELWNKKEHGE